MYESFIRTLKCAKVCFDALKMTNQTQAKFIKSKL